MSEVQIAGTSGGSKQLFVPAEKPELDEELWRAWKAKNREKDRARASRRRKVLLCLSVAIPAGFLLLRVIL